MEFNIEGITAGAVVILVFKELFVIIRALIEQRNGKVNPSPDMILMGKQMEEMHKWHDQSDADGVKIWYGRSLMRPLAALADSIAEQTGILKELVYVARENLEATKKLNGK